MALLLSNSKQLGYEGLILRDMNMPYQIDKRSKGLIKVKQFMDAEFKVVDIVPSSDMWAILICEIPGSGLTFRVSAPGTMYQKEGVYRRKDEFIGERVTVSFANYTVDGKPFHPIAERWKQDL